MATKHRARRGAQTKIEAHPDREKIEFELAIGRPLREVAEKYSVSKSACQRHQRKIPSYLRAANLGQLLVPGMDLEKLKLEEGQGLIAIIANQRARNLMIQDRAMELGEHALAVQASGRIREWVELSAKYLGLLVQHTTTTSVNVIMSPAYMKLRNIVVDVMRQAPPEISAEFSRRLKAAESEELGGLPASPPLITYQA
jgi:hypothetical protein